MNRCLLKQPGIPEDALLRATAESAVVAPRSCPVASYTHLHYSVCDILV
jgi:hypothetical protein